MAASAGKRFGPGGTYNGYIDRVTRGTLDNIAKEQSPTGIYDDQLPAIARLPAIVARYHNDASLAEMLAQSMQVTNINDVAASYSDAFADVLVRVMRDEHVHSADRVSDHPKLTQTNAFLRASM